MVSSVNNERMKRWNGIEMKLRQLGTGRWDRKLIERIMEKSNSPIQEFALREWKATGNCWWPKEFDDRVPDWVSEAENGYGFCLCGHTIYYHFEIVNTETDERECVGSDHINAYMIARNIAEEMEIDIETVSEAQIQIWIRERVKNMKAEAWWEEKGDWFNDLIEGLEPVDQWLNYHVPKNGGDYRYDSTYRRHVAIKVPIKKGSGNFGSSDYQMASVFWRWNNLQNSRAQIRSRGYPNDKLLADMVLLSMKKGEYAEHKKKVDAANARRLQHLEEERIRMEELRRENAKNEEKRRELAKERARKMAIEKANTIDEWGSEPVFQKAISFYGMTVPFCSALVTDAANMNDLYRIMNTIRLGHKLNNNQIKRMAQIMSNKTRATDKQINYIKDLGGFLRGPTNKIEASRLISFLMEGKK